MTSSVYNLGLRFEGLFRTMIGKNRQLVTYELVEFEKEPVEVQDNRKITDRFRGVYRIHPKFTKGKPEDVNM